jgi:hypothetical protein
MFVRRGIAAIVTLVALMSTASLAQAQVNLTLAGGATFPTGDYGKYANTGYIASAGLLFKVGTNGLSLGGQGFYGANSHSDFDGDKTTLSGVLGTVTYRLGDATKPGVFLTGNIGLLSHKYSSDKFPSEEGSSSGLAFGGGAGVAIPRGSMNFYVVARYLTASIDNETTSFIPVQAGVTIPLGSKK